MNILAVIPARYASTRLPGKPLLPLAGKPMIEWVIGQLNTIQTEKRFIFVVNDDECIKYHLDNVLNLLTDNKCRTVKLNNETKGAACSALMAIEFIDNDDELLISNGDQIIDADLAAVIQDHRRQNIDAAVICFESVHPKWSYVRLDENNKIIETSEKNPISKNAIAGWYYFKHGKDFVRAAMNSIKKDANVNGLYFVAPTLNELILEGKNLGIYRIESVKYHSFYSPQKIKEYEEGHFVYSAD